MNASSSDTVLQDREIPDPNDGSENRLLVRNRQIYEKSQVNRWKPTNPKLTEACLLKSSLMPWNKIIPLICSDLLTKLSACFYNPTGLSLRQQRKSRLCNASNSSDAAPNTNTHKHARTQTHTSRAHTPLPSSSPVSTKCQLSWHTALFAANDYLIAN